MEVQERGQEIANVTEKLEKSLAIDQVTMEKYTSLISEGKAVAKLGDVNKALELFKLAYNIHQTPKLEKRIKKIEEIIALNQSEDESDEFVNVNNSGLLLYKELHDKLYEYQKEGVSFLYGLLRDGRKGGILADDMGLGKTIQVISFLSGMYDNGHAKHTLLVMPMSLITNWIKEFAKWTPGMRVKEFHGASKAERTRSLEKVQKKTGVVLTTYTMLMNNWQQLATYQGQEFTWDYMILDEAHKIKNTTTKTAKSAYAIPSKNRILLTGTPVQNNLREMWTLFDFACQGTLLGTAKTFKTEFENPITRAREKDATPAEMALGSRMSEYLMATIKPYFLRRTKAEVQRSRLANPDQQQITEDNQDQNNPAPVRASMPNLTRKNDLIVWTYLSEIQEDIYRQFIGLDHIKELLLTSRSPLAELTILKKLCDHPRLLSASAMAKLGWEEESPDDERGGDASGIANVPDSVLIAESGKLVFLLALLKKLRKEGHRTLVFTHYRTVLDILERILTNRGFGVLRLDGTITQTAERERLISKFQTDKCMSVFLLTTQVGGVGITLTAASRVVIYDPSWNPATDAQAVDRAYRIGQTENVIIYRLITCGTVEEKIYRRQIFKDSLIRQNTGDKKNPFRYFSSQELKELFTLENPSSSSTQLQLQALHSQHRRTDPVLDRHIADLHKMEMFGISDHDLLFSLDHIPDEVLENQEEQHYIEGRVQKAQELVKAESELQMQVTERMPVSREQSRNRKQRTSKSSNSPQRSQSIVIVPEVVNLGDSTPANESCQLVVNNEDDMDDFPAITPPESPEPSTGLRFMSARAHSPADDDSNFVTPPQTRKFSVPHQSGSSSNIKAESSGMRSVLEASFGNFNLQLEDSDRNVDVEETEEQQRRLLAELRRSSFDVNKSLSESGHRQFSRRGGANSSVSINESIVTSTRKRTAVMYDSDDEEASQLSSRNQLNSSFQVLGTSTPKAARSSTSLRSPRYNEPVNFSVVSQRSLLQSMIDEVDDSDDEEVAEANQDGNEQSGGTNCNIVLNGDDLEEEEEAVEMVEETNPNSVREERISEQMQIGEAEQIVNPSRIKGSQRSVREARRTQRRSPSPRFFPVDDHSGDEMSLILDETDSEPDMSPSERMDHFAPQPQESYESLVRQGRECYSQSKLEEALGFFLQAIDLQPGDPDVQFMTIQLYRQLSKK